MNKNKKGLHESELLSSHWPVVSCCVERRRKWYMVGRVGFWNRTRMERNRFLLLLLVLLWTEGLEMTLCTAHGIHTTSGSILAGIML